jgi:hypothetical protein
MENEMDELKKLIKTIESLKDLIKRTHIYDDEKPILHHKLFEAQLRLRNIIEEFFPGFLSGSYKSDVIKIPNPPSLNIENNPLNQIHDLYTEINVIDLLKEAKENDFGEGCHKASIIRMASDRCV